MPLVIALVPWSLCHIPLAITLVAKEIALVPLAIALVPLVIAYITLAITLEAKDIALVPLVIALMLRPFPWRSGHYPWP